MVAGVHFSRSGIPDLEPRLREPAMELIAQTLGPGDESRYEATSLVLVNTRFAWVMRASTLDLGTDERTPGPGYDRAIDRAGVRGRNRGVHAS
ncbi:hypothetical protein [Nocardia salmonicida]|uniref:hypothetical protein n=1 Tax=Nocardia salmonicida TaxID=53431 RepID=UPI003CF8AF2B